LRQSFRETDKNKKSFFIELAANVFSVQSITAFRIYEIVLSVLKKTNVKVISITWEGHSFERLVCQAVKTVPKKIVCIAYQHSILLPSSHALKRSIGRVYDPDVILTVGSVTKNIIESTGNIDAVLKEYGSPRLKNKKSYSVNKEFQNACLVAPEGLTEESIRLFTFGIAVAESMPEILFIFRTHPQVHFEDLQALNKRLKNLPANVIVSSNKNVDEDIARTSWIIYRCSSVAFFATLAGSRPVYLQVENELSIDPLYELNSWRLQVTHPDEMKLIIEFDKRTTQVEKEAEKKQALEYCEKYMLPYQMPVFEDCIIEHINS
jgi:hypothetical protein